MTYIKGSPSHWTEDMTDTVVVYKGTTMDAYGKRATSGSGTTYNCRIMADNTKITTDQKRGIIEEGRLIILNDPNVDVGDRITLSNGAEPIVKMVDKVNYRANGSGVVNHHTVVTFGRV
jgi:hypothetical protein